MYQINNLNDKLQWEQFALADSKAELFKTLRYNLGVQTQILYNDWYLVNLDGSLEQLDWFIEHHDNKLNATIRAINFQKKYDELKGKQKVKDGRPSKY